MTSKELKKIRMQLGYEKKEMAEQLGCFENTADQKHGMKTYNNWESGRIPIPASVQILASNMLAEKL